MKKLFGLLLALLAVVSCEEGVLFESTLKFAEGETLTFKGFETKRLTVIHTPEDADLGEGNIKWSTSDPMIAKARRGGFVEAIGIGECDIKAEAYVADQYVSAVCHVVVGEVKIAALMVDSARTFFVGDSIQLIATYEPENATITDLIWESSDATIATVTQDGYVEAIKEGSCVISVFNKDKSVVAKCKVTILPVKMTSLTISETNCEIEVGDSVTLAATFTPDNVTYADLYWESSDEAIAVVDRETGKITGVGVGECTITVCNPRNDMTASCHLTVLPAPVKNISLNKTSLATIIGQAHKLSCTITPEYATNKEVKWESSNNAVATVAADGTVTAISIGEAMIKVTAQDGSGCSAECVVKVYDEKTYIENSISIKQTGITSAIGPWGSYYSYSFKVDNNGDETVYLKEVRGYGSTSGTIAINKQIGPGESYSESFNTNSHDWVFEINGIECTKRYNP